MPCQELCTGLSILGCAWPGSPRLVPSHPARALRPTSLPASFSAQEAHQVVHVLARVGLTCGVAARTVTDQIHKLFRMPAAAAAMLGGHRGSAWSWGDHLPMATARQRLFMAAEAALAIGSPPSNWPSSDWNPLLESRAHVANMRILQPCFQRLAWFCPVVDTQAV